jgi:hypothetical protein
MPGKRTRNRHGGRHGHGGHQVAGRCDPWSHRPWRVQCRAARRSRGSPGASRGLRSRPIPTRGWRQSDAALTGSPYASKRPTRGISVSGHLKTLASKLVV